MVEAHEKVVEAQFGPQARAYVESAVHASGADLDAVEALVRELRPELALDLGAGGGHVAYVMARHARRVIAADLSREMLAAVAATARGKGLSNIETVEAPAERLPFEDSTFDFVASRFSAHHWRDFGAGLQGSSPGVETLAAGPCSSTPTLLGLRCSTRISRRSNCCATIRTSATTPARNGSTRSPGRASPIEACRTWKLRMDFPVWTARMRTPEENVRAIRALQIAASSETKTHFAIEPDGSFLLDVMMIEASAA